MFACIHAPNAGVLADSFSPWVEAQDSSTAIFPLSPRQLAGRVWEQIPATVAVASTVEAAVLAAHNLLGCTFIAPGDEERVLGPLPVECLAGEDRGVLELFEIFDRWGIRTLADLAQLPEAELSARLGVAGVELQRRARGMLDRPLRSAAPAATYEESAEFDHPIELREPLLFVIGRFLHDLIARMRAQSVAACALCLTFNGDEKRRNLLPFPTLDLKLLLKLVEHSLERQPPDAPVERVYVALEPTRPRRVQHGLFTPAAPEPEKLELTLGKIRGLVGEKNAGYPELFDTHQPGVGKPLANAFLPTLAFRYFRPPLEARVDLEAGAPKYVSTKMFRGQVVRVAGPWRSSGDWWRPDGWRWDEWDLVLNDGALYRLHRDRRLQQWFIEGVYD